MIKKMVSNKLAQSVMLGGMLIPSFAASAISFGEIASADTIVNDKTESTQASNSLLSTVTKVNGNPLIKNHVVKQGDTVTFDVVYFPGNKGLMSSFKDILPEGLSFNDTSDKTVSVFAVNNDGSIGNNITSDGSSSIKGQTYSWTPKTPTNYLFVGSKGTQNRLLFHITAKVNSNVNENTVLENTATGITTNPKTKKDYPVNDTATVYTPGNPKKPTIIKSVFSEVLNPADAKDTTDKTVSLDLTISTTDKDDEIRSKSKALIAAAKLKGVDTSLLDQSLAKYKSTLTDTQKQIFVSEFKAIAQSYEKVVNGEFSNTASFNDSIDLTNHDDLYTYTAKVSLPSQSIKKSLVISDPMEHVQSYNLKNVHFYDASGADITNQGALSEKDEKNKKTILWTASQDFVNKLKNANTNTEITMKISHVTLKGADVNDEDEYKVGNQVTIPNVAHLNADGDDVPSNPTTVRPPQPKGHQPSTIVKGVELETGNNVDNTVGDSSNSVVKIDPVTGKSNFDIDWGTLSDTDLISKSNLLSVRSSADPTQDNNKNALNEQFTTALNSFLSNKSQENKTALIKAATVLNDYLNNKTVSVNVNGETKEVKKPLDQGQNSINLPTHDSLYKYLLNVSINPDAAKHSIVISDPMESVQSKSINIKNVKLYDAYGNDITNHFKLSQGTAKMGTQTTITATADDDLVKAVRNSKDMYHIKMVTSNISLKDDKTSDENNYILDGRVKVPNVGSLILDGKTINSNKTLVIPPLPAKTPKQTPINTGMFYVKRNPWVLITTLVLAGAAIVGTTVLKLKKSK